MTESPNPSQVAPDRGVIIEAGVAVTARWSLRLLLVSAAALVAGYVIGWAWVMVLPVLLAILISTVLEPVSRWLHRHGVPRTLAALLTLLVALAALGGLLSLVVRSVLNQADSIADQASDGFNTIREYVTGPPLNLDNTQLDSAVGDVADQLSSSATTIANEVLTGLSTISSLLVTIVLAVVLVFFFLKDGHRFPPFVEQVVGRRAGTHLREVLQRAWAVLGGYVRVQALVALVDATFIGIGVAILGVPLALTIAVITFLFSFIPIVGAITAGLLAILLALVTNGWVTALLVLAVVLVVQQIEGNILQPILQSQSLQLHPGIILLAVTGGGSLFGIVGALLAVPVVGVLWEVGRYIGERIDARTGTGDVVELDDPESTADTKRPDDPAHPETSTDPALDPELATDQGTLQSGAAPA